MSTGPCACEPHLAIDFSCAPMDRESAAVVIQARIRGWNARKLYSKKLVELFEKQNAQWRERERMQVLDGETLLETVALRREISEKQMLYESKQHRLSFMATRIQRAWRKYIKSSNASTSAAALLCKKSKIQHPRPMDQNKDSKYHLLYTIDVSDTSSEGLPKEYETAELDLLDHHSKALNSSYYCGEFEFELDAELELPTDSDKTFSVPTKPTVVMDHTTSTLLHEKLVPELQHLAGSLQSRLDDKSSELLALLAERENLKLRNHNLQSSVSKMIRQLKQLH